MKVWGGKKTSMLYLPFQNISWIIHFFLYNATKPPDLKVAGGYPNLWRFWERTAKPIDKNIKGMWADWSNLEVLGPQYNLSEFLWFLLIYFCLANMLRFFQEFVFLTVPTEPRVDRFCSPFYLINKFSMAYEGLEK